MFVIAAERARQAVRDVAAKRARIAAVTAQRERLDRRREVLEMERKKKLAEARAARKPGDKVCTCSKYIQTRRSLCSDTPVAIKIIIFIQ